MAHPKRLVLVQSDDVPLYLCLDLPEDFQLCALVADRDPELAPLLTEWWLESIDGNGIDVPDHVRASIELALSGSMPGWLARAYRQTVANAEATRIEERAGL